MFTFIKFSINLLKIYYIFVSNILELLWWTQTIHEGRQTTDNVRGMA